jgi:hypothetical protein
MVIIVVIRNGISSSKRFIVMESRAQKVVMTGRTPTIESNQAKRAPRHENAIAPYRIGIKKRTPTILYINSNEGRACHDESAENNRQYPVICHSLHGQVWYKKIRNRLITSIHQK